MDVAKRWYVQSSNGNIEGPFPTETVEARIFARFITPETPLSDDGRSFRSAMECLGKDAFVERPSPIFSAPAASVESILILCEFCGSEGRAPANAVGKRIKCKQCDNAFVAVPHIPSRASNNAEAKLFERTVSPQSPQVMPHVASTDGKMPNSKNPLTKKLGKTELIFLGIFGAITLIILAWSDFAPNADKGSKIRAFQEATTFVRERLKSPSTASFPWADEGYVTESSPGHFVVRAYVDSQNGFGAMIRTKFTVSLKYAGKNKWQFEDISLE